MRIGVVSPTTLQCIEKMAALFPDGVEVVGPLADNQRDGIDPNRKQDEWQRLGLRIQLRHEPHAIIDFSEYDLLIESAETFTCCRDWHEESRRLECPVLVKASRIADPRDCLPDHYLESRRGAPVLLGMPTHRQNWLDAGFQDVLSIGDPAGDWWFEKPWTGEDERIVFVLSGAGAWRGDDRSRFGLELWEEIRRRFPQAAYHHDGRVRYLTSLEMADLFRRSRVFVNLDRTVGNGERPLAVSFSEALSSGLPVVARDLPGLSYQNFVDTNGVCTNDLDEMFSFLERCLKDYEFARECSRRSREIAMLYFHRDSLLPRYQSLIERTTARFTQSRSYNAPTKRTAQSDNDDIFETVVSVYHATRPVQYVHHDAVKSFYEGIDFWDKFRDWVNGPNSYATFDRQFVDQHVRIDGRRVVNVGCYYPWAERVWGRRAKRWLAIDISERVLERASQTLTADELGSVTFLRRDMAVHLEEDVLAELQSDVLLDLSTFDQLEPTTWSQALQNYGLLGRQIILAYDGGDELPVRYDYENHGFNAWLHPKTVDRMLRAAGFEIRDHQPFYYYHRSYVFAERRSR